MTAGWDRFSLLAAQGKHELLGFLQRAPEDKNPHAAGLPVHGWGRHDKSHSPSSESSGGVAEQSSGASAAAGTQGECARMCSCDESDCFFWALLVFILLLCLLCALLGLVKQWQNQNEEEIDKLRKQLEEQQTPRTRAASGGYQRRPLSARVTPPPSVRDPPVLGADKDAKLKAVLAKNNVSLDLPAREIRPKDQIAFEEPDEKGGSSSSRPVARFSSAEGGRSGDAMEILKDVAAIMAIYDTAILCVEGHTEERPGQGEKQAMQLAQSKADLVKSSLVSFGVRSENVAAVGLPGNLGSKKNGVALRITSF